MKRSLQGTALGLLAVLGGLGCGSGPKHVASPSRSTQMPSITFGLTDDQFWAQPAGAMDAVINKADAAGFKGILLEGPTSVDLAKSDDATLLGLRRCTNEEDFLVVMAWRAVLVAVSKETNACHAALAFENKSEDGEDKKERVIPDEGIREGWSTAPFSVNVRERLKGIPWTPGIQTFYMFLSDKGSNPAPVRFFHPATQDPEVAAALKAKLKPGYPKPVWPKPDALNGHSFEKLLSSPKPPDTLGIVLQAERVTVVAKGGKCMVRGAFRLPALSGEQVRPKPAPGSESADTVMGNPWSDVGDAKAKAVIPVTLLITGDRATGPWMFPLQVPVYGAPREDVLEGYFNVNLQGMDEGFGFPQTYVVRALHGAAQSEPVKFSLVTKNMLPK